MLSSLKDFFVKKKPDPLDQASWWPINNEIRFHLDYCPYIDLQLSFSAKELLDEAKKLTQYFVDHRPYEHDSKSVEGGWKSLALKAHDGNYKNTGHHSDYGVKEGNYQLTEMAKKCPQTMAFLDTITDLTKCERIRFMYLGPHSEIECHRDSDKDVCQAINISLNMPTGCELITDLNADGSPNSYTKTVPFKDEGSVILFNNAKFHKVVNHSDIPRIHIIFHGPLKIQKEKIVELAKKQNNEFNRKRLINSLIDKKFVLGEEVRADSLLYHEWKRVGPHLDSLKKVCPLIIINGGLKPAEERKQTHLITSASLFPLRHDIISLENCDQLLNDYYQKGERYVCLLFEGTYIEDIHLFMGQTAQLVSVMCKEQAFLAGHLMDQKDRVPYLHHQFLILDLNKYFSLNNKLDKSTRSYEMNFPSYGKSSETIHDDYTPLWIDNGVDNIARHGKGGFGSKLMAEAIEKNFRLINIPYELRNSKSFSYPDNPNDTNVEKKIEERLEFVKNHVFYFNTEIVNFAMLDDFVPNIFMSVCSGFKPYKMMDIYWRKREIEKLIYMDFSLPALRHFEKMNKNQTKKELIDYLFDKIGEKDPTLKRGDIIDQFDNMVSESFDGELNRFFETITQTKNAVYLNKDFVTHRETICEQLDGDSIPLIWVSNSFYNSALYFHLTKEEAYRCFLDVGLAIAEKLQTKAWVHKSLYTILFSDALDTKPRGIITDGCLYNSKEFDTRNWSSF